MHGSVFKGRGKCGGVGERRQSERERERQKELSSEIAQAVRWLLKEKIKVVASSKHLMPMKQLSRCFLSSVQQELV